VNRKDLAVPRANINIIINGEPVEVHAGSSVAVALLQHGIAEIRRTPLGQESRGVFCGMGSCYDCVATVNGERSVRTCITEAVSGMTIETTGTRTP
jgi:aerobic-type carbon monoxide dehydrogenase small subunit (CoxS/CutS family)